MRFKWPQAAHVGDGTSLMRGQLGEGRNRKTPQEKMMGPAHEFRRAGRANGGLIFMPVLSALAFSGSARDDIKEASRGVWHLGRPCGRIWLLTSC